MNTKQFYYVLTLAKERSFSKASDALDITQPSLSQYIKKIEREVGMDLFERIKGEVRLTDAGRVYIQIGRQILDLEHQMENAFTDLASNKTGSLVIGAAPYRAASMMPTIVSLFQKKYPGIHLIVREGTTSELVEGMEHGEYDLALTLLPIDKRVFSYEKVVEEEMVLAVPFDHSEFRAVTKKSKKYPAIDAKELSGQRMVMLTETQYMQRQLDDLLHDYNIHVKKAVIVKSLQAQIQMVKAGVGIALVPSGISYFCRNDVKFYSFLDDLPKREVVVMWRKDHKLSTVAQDLKQMIHDISW